MPNKVITVEELKDVVKMIPSELNNADTNVTEVNITKNINHETVVIIKTNNKAVVVIKTNNNGNKRT
jgi:hypothetical protein